MAKTKTLRISPKRHLELQKELLKLKPRFRTLQDLAEFKLAVKIK